MSLTRFHSRRVADGRQPGRGDRPRCRDYGMRECKVLSARGRTVKRRGRASTRINALPGMFGLLTRAWVCRDIDGRRRSTLPL